MFLVGRHVKMEHCLRFEFALLEAKRRLDHVPYADKNVNFGTGAIFNREIDFIRKTCFVIKKVCVFIRKTTVICPRS